MSESRITVAIEALLDVNKNALRVEEAENKIFADIYSCLKQIKHGVYEIVKQGEIAALDADRGSMGPAEVDQSTKGGAFPSNTSGKITPEKVGGNLATVFGGIGVGIAAAIPAIVGGFVYEITTSFARLVKALSAAFRETKLFALIKSYTGMVGNTVKSLFDPIIEFFTKMGTQVRSYTGMIGNTVKSFFDPVIDVFRKGGSIVKSYTGMIANTVDSFFEPIVKFFRSMGSTLTSSEGFKMMGESLEKLKNIKLPKLGFIDTLIDTIRGSIQAVTKIASPIIKFFAGFGRVLGRLFYPIGILMSVFDSLMGAIDGFKDAQAMDAGFFQTMFQTLGAATIGLIKGLILMPLDLLKDMTSWALEKLGLEKLSAMMDSFSFEDSIGGLLEQLLDFLVYTIPNYLKGKVADILDFIGMDETANNMRAGIESQNETRQEYRSSEDARDEAEKMGLIDPSFFGDDDLDETKLKDASPKQLQAVLDFHADDLSEEDVKLVQDELASRPVRGDGKRGKTIGDSPAAPTERGEDGKLGMTIGDSPAAPTERGEDGKLGKTIGSSSSSTTSNSTSSNSSSSNSSSSNSTSSNSSSSNIVYDVNDPVTGELIATTSTTEEAIRLSMETGGYIVSRVSSTEKVGVGTIQTALSPTSTAQSVTPTPSVTGNASGSNTMGAMRDNLSNEQTRLEETKAKESGGGASVAMVNAPSSSSTTVNNSNFSGGAMSSTDNTDRTYGNYKSSRR